MAKKNCIYVNDMIWADEDLDRLQPETTLRFIFLIAWSKACKKDGWFSDFAMKQVRGTDAQTKELLSAGLIVETQVPAAGYLIRSFEEWQNNNIANFDSDPNSFAAKQSARGKVGMAKRWGKPSTVPAPDGSFDVEQAGAECFATWPEQSETRFREKRTEAVQAFVQNITAEEYEAFKSALAHRLSVYSNESGHDRRKFLGAFKNFCVKWQDWIPKDYGIDAVVVPEREPNIWRPSMDDL